MTGSHLSARPSSGQSYFRTLLFATTWIFAATPLVASAGVCDVAWDGDKVVAAIAGRPAHIGVPLKDKQQRITQLTVGQIQAFSDAKDRISSTAGLSPHFIICGGDEPNAFATRGNNGDIVGVTVGMLRLVNSDQDMAAAVIGHEVAHHTKGHGAIGQARDALIGLAGLIIGIALDAKLQNRNPANAGLGLNLAQIGSTLVSRKFDRDQEREADEVGFGYMVAARFNPNGAVRLSERMNQVGGGIGLFFDTHPGWPERTARFQTLIAGSPQAQQLAALSTTPTRLSTVESANTQITALLPTYETSDAQKSYTNGIAAWRAKDIGNAVREFRSAASAGYAPAQVTVGYFYETGTSGLSKDLSEALRLYRLAADQGNAQGQNNLASMYFRGAGVEKNLREASRLYRLAADQGNALAQANLAIMYGAGTGGLLKDDNEVIRLAKLSADQGNASGQNVLAVMYQFGRGGIAKDDMEAARLYKLAADQGHAYAQANLASMYMNGRGGLPKDEVEGIRLLKLSAAQDNPQAQATLGFAYVSGAGGLPKDAITATGLYRRAADQGNSFGQANLGFMYLRGLGGVQKDEMEALRLFRKAADQGNALGQNNLGSMYENGAAGLARDLDEAIAWYQKAAAQGNSTAIANLKRLGRM